MKLQDIPIEQRYYGNAKKTQGREVREGWFDGATEYWCPAARGWNDSDHKACERHGGGKFWSRPIDVGEGWRLVGLDEAFTTGLQSTEDGTAWVGHVWVNGNPTIKKAIEICFADPTRVRPIAFRRRIESKPGEWVSVDERCPWKSDADENGCVLALRKNSRSWRAVDWVDVSNGNYSHWMKQPPLPTPEKSEAEIAWEQCIEKDVLHENSFIAGFAAGKGQK